MKHKVIMLLTVAVTAAVLAMPHYNTFSQSAYIKWVDFNVPYTTLSKVYELDVKTHKEEFHYRFADVLAYIAAQNGNNFNYKKDMAYLEKLKNKIEKGQSFEDITKNSKYYNYYKEAYGAIFAEYIGYFTQESSGNDMQYGLKTYFPFAQGYWYSGSDDFGNSRSYGFKRVHLGHDMFGSIGTPIIAVEGGIVTELGWNKYGGWRIGIRSLDNLRYYYYAHLRKDAPYVKEMKKGSIIEAGQVIGYLGVTGYSNKENKNMGTKPHLHFGLQLIFDKSQEDGNGEIWIDVYNITRFLVKNRAKVQKNADTNDYYSINLKKAFK
ncbi:MAG: M23 family metallopeptidase [Clostridia bacterium]|nr:M23 family metallopeptidase [Clostridia bacterium]